MATAPNRKVDPALIFEQGDCFYQALAILCNVHPDNVEIAVILGEPVMVVGALTIELFLKCLVSVETGEVPRGHDLKDLYDRLSEATRQRIQGSWDNGIAVRRKAEWDEVERVAGVIIARDLPSALAVGSKAFELIRYSYEGNTGDLQYYLQDLPALLGRIILELKPEFRSVRRRDRPQQDALPH